MAKDIEEALNEIYSLIDKDDFAESLNRLSILDREYSKDVRYKVYRIGVLSEIFRGLGDEARLIECIRGSKLFRKPQHQILNPYLHQKLAHANMDLFQIKLKKAKTFPVMDSSLQEAKRHLREAIVAADSKDVSFVVSLWIDYGNCLDTLGRGLEAMYAYDNALKFQPDHPMAIGNKAMALSNFANISGAHFPEMNRKALDMLKSIVGRDNMPPSARTAFENGIQSIERMFREHPDALQMKFNHKPRNTKKDTLFERMYYDFCSSNKLFLNLHIHEDECESSMLDSVSIRLILPIGDRKTYPKLANFLNQIKQDYATSRLLLVQSQYRDKAISRLSGRTVYTDTLEYCEFSLRNGLLESAYKGVYDILDKIAGFINEYLGMGLDKVQFDAGVNIQRKSIWVKEDGNVRDAILNADNMSLYALYDIFQDFESGHLGKLKSIRNSLTHRRVQVHMWGNNGDSNSFSKDELKVQTIELMKLVKSAIIYLINFIFLEEEKKMMKAKGPVPPVYLPHQTNSD